MKIYNVPASIAKNGGILNLTRSVTRIESDGKQIVITDSQFPEKYEE
jgi:hypothetical protein